MTKKLYVTDLDGTLLNSQGEISEYSVQVLNHLIRRGVLITVASARSLASIKKILKNVNLTLPVVSFNGGYVSNIHTEKHLVVNEINKHLSEELYDYIKVDHGMFISTNRHGKDVLCYDRMSSIGMSDYHKDREEFLNVSVNKIEDFDELDNYKIMTYTVIDTKETILDLKDRLNRKYGGSIVVDAWEDMYYKPWFWLTIHSINSTKACGLMNLCKLVDSTYDVIVFGDNNNDVEMFKYAAQSYAVVNAVDELKTHATGIIGHHDDDSVVKKILELEGEQYDFVQ